MSVLGAIWRSWDAGQKAFVVYGFVACLLGLAYGEVYISVGGLAALTAGIALRGYILSEEVVDS